MITVIQWVLQTVLLTAIMIPIVICLCQYFRNHPSVQHAFWFLVLLKFVMPPITPLTVELPSITQVGPQQPVEQFSSPALAELRSRQATAGAGHSEPGSDDLHQALADASFGQPAGSSLWSDFPDALWFWLSVPAAMIWGVGALLIGCRQFRIVRRQAGILAKSIPASSRLQAEVAEVAQRMNVKILPVRVAAGIASPMIWCLSKPQLIWPAEMDQEETGGPTKAIIAHELSHIRRRDHWVAWVDLAAGVLWWWNPLVWYVQKQLRVTAEIACDTVALAEYPDEKSIYADTLFAMSFSPNGMPALGLAVGTGTPSALERRLRMMMSESVSGKLSLKGILAAVLLSAASLPAFSTEQSNEQDVSSQGDESSEDTSQADQSAADALRVQNLHRILTAMHNYHDAFGAFPPAVIVDPVSKVSRSWRVDLLPFLGEAELYDQYKRNEPWDSETNRMVLKRIPSVYRRHGQPESSTLTGIAAACGRGMVFEAPSELAESQVRGVNLSKMQDGSAFTIAILEAQKDIPWTKPEELVFDLKESELPEFNDQNFYAGFADGTIARFPRTIKAPVLKAYLTTSGKDAKDMELDSVYLEKMKAAFHAGTSVPVSPTPAASR